MVFKSDKQRKAVMAKLNQGNLKSDIQPTVITGIGGKILVDKRPSKNNDISKSEFESFVRVRDSGVTNMFDTRAVSQFSGLDKEKIISIMKNFNSLSRKFPGVVR